MDAQPVSDKFVYYDTNALAYINDGEVPDFIRQFSAAGFSSVTSDIAIDELIDGFETDIFKKHNFVYVYSHEPLFLEGQVNFYSSIEASKGAYNTDTLENFLGAVLRSLAGSRSVNNLDTLFWGAHDELIGSMKEELPPGTDPRILDQLHHAQKVFGEGLNNLPAAVSPIVSREQLEEQLLGPKFLGNIRPPNVVNKVTAHYPDSAEWINCLLIPLSNGNDIKARIQELCIALVLVGFARDKNLGKDDSTKSEQGARAQFQDFSHICAGAVCSIFLTSDKRCAKLAFAVYEALRLNTSVVHLNRSNPEMARLLVVGEDYWP